MIPCTKTNKNFVLEKSKCLNNKEKKNFEIVVTRFDENLNYLKNYEDFLTVYNKGKCDLSLNCKIVNRPNIGRDGETIFYHIVNNWDNLSDVTLFSQGYINDRNDQLISYNDFENYSNTNDIYFFEKRYDLPNFDEKLLNFHIKFKDIYKEIFNEEYKKNFPWVAGMWISVKKDIIKRVPYNIYQNVLNLFDKYKQYDDSTCRILAIHCERLLLHILTKNYSNIQNNIFLLWLQGWNKAPPLQIKVAKSWKKHNPYWNIVLLDFNNLKNYVNDIDYIYDRNKNITPQALSDIIRLSLLKNCGGIWADATLVCLKPVNSWLNEYTKEEDFFMYHDSGGGMDIQYGPCSWFIVSGKENYIIEKWKSSCDIFWKNNNSTNNYFWMDNLFKNLFENDETFKNKWNNVKYIYARKDGNAHTLSIHTPENNTPYIQEMIKNNPPEVIKLWNYFNNYLLKLPRDKLLETNGGFILNLK